ncbi:putative ankyrin repeat-containing domain superfamily [Helianthus annuus]|nr:putative ankyrin repeat-containing domain superfamily [Helianthus annuus]
MALQNPKTWYGENIHIQVDTNSIRMSNLNHVISDLPIFKAALHDDWVSVSELFEQDPELMTKPITYWWETPLIIAVEANSCSNRFVEKLVERIVAVGAEDKLFLTSHGGNNSLHYAAKGFWWSTTLK